MAMVRVAVVGWAMVRWVMGPVAVVVVIGRLKHVVLLEPRLHVVGGLVQLVAECVRHIINPGESIVHQVLRLLRDIFPGVLCTVLGVFEKVLKLADNVVLGGNDFIDNTGGLVVILDLEFAQNLFIGEHKGSADGRERQDGGELHVVGGVEEKG
jgi:hypothetical protein